jgi:Ca2+-binding EF-hand superfamily protein
LRLFLEIQRLDGMDDGFISKRELKLLLERLNIYFSARKFNDAFALFDNNYDGHIGLREFYDFIYPPVITVDVRDFSKFLI